MKGVFQAAGDRFSYVIVEDLQKEAGFDEAVKGVDAILHIASPLYRTAPVGVWKNIIEPAKVGTTAVMSAALKHNPNVKRVVITSSYGAVGDSARPRGTVFTEADWNNSVKEYAIAKGDDCEPFNAYFASKVIAEEAAWEFMKMNEPRFDLITLLPPLVCGPIIGPVDKPASLNTSNFQLWGFLTGSKNFNNTFAVETPAIPIVDVRDVAIAHVECLLCDEAGNKRISITNGLRCYQEFLDVIHEQSELVSAFPNAHWGKAGRTEGAVPKNDLDNSLSVKLLGLQYRDWKVTALDAVRSLASRAVVEAWDVKETLP